MPDTYSFWLEVAKISVPVLIGVASMYIGYKQYQKTRIHKSQDDERNEIYKRLNDFYGPLLQLRKKSELIYRQFSKELKQQNSDFRTITHLLEKKPLTNNQQELLREIVTIGEKCENLINDKAGLIDDEELRRNILPQFTTHLLLLRMAFEGRLESHDVAFKDHAFPRSLDTLLEKRIEKLEQRLKAINEVT